MSEYLVGFNLKSTGDNTMGYIRKHKDSIIGNAVIITGSIFLTIGLPFITVYFAAISY